jgi:4-amino-4-deoxychorismate lyase
MTNLFVVLGDALHTPLLTEAGVAGVMRHKIVEQAQTLDVETNFSCIPLDQLRQASELFLSNSMIGIWPVAALDHWNYDPGPITKMIMRALSSIGVEECAT